MIRFRVSMMAVIGLLISSMAFAAPAVIANGSKVKLNYTLTVDGQIVDQTPAERPLEYVQGNNALLPALEQQLEGLKAGEQLQAVIPPDQGFGEMDPEAVIEVPKSNLPEGEIEVGTVLAAESPEGAVLRGSVKEVRDESVLLDFNHPLAGKELHFDINVLEVS